MGTRAEIIKMSPLYFALQERGANPVVWHVGQHEELAWPFYEFFGISPALHMPLGRQKQTLGHLSALIMEKLDNTLRTEDASCVVVQGDTSTAFLAALSSFYYKIPIAHVEAGLRTYREYEPFPEEKNRELLSRLAHWHFTPTGQAKNNLLAEGIAEKDIHIVGNTIVDATLWGVKHLEGNDRPYARSLDFPVEQYEQYRQECRLIVVTAHRRENWEQGIREIASGIRTAIDEHNDIFVVWPLHPNPLIKDAVKREMDYLDQEQRKRVLLTTPLQYPVMLHLLKQAWLVLTDSGGIQEEAITLGIPVLVLREATERPEVVSAGGGAVIGTHPDNIVQWISRLTENTDMYSSMRGRPNPFGDGHASDRIAEILIQNLG